MECSYYIGHIDGISKENTLYFSSIARQEAFILGNMLPLDIDTFYPPFYYNEIKFSTDDVSFLTKVNYFCIQVRDNNRRKNYYYFINSLSYINPNMISISIEMDTVQTYYFDCVINNAIIERAMISRFNGSNINRSYIRENLSNGIFKTISRSLVNGNEKIFAIAVAAVVTGESVPNTGFNKITYVPPLGEFVSPSPTFTSQTFIAGIADANPEANAQSYGRQYSVTTNQSGSDVTYTNLGNPQYCMFRPYMNYIHYIPFNPFYDVNVVDDTHISVTGNSGHLFYNSDPTLITGLGSWMGVITPVWGTVNSRLTPNVFKSDVRAKVYKVSIATIATKADGSVFPRPYSSDYITAMSDTNYVQYSFGSTHISTKFPIELMTTTLLFGYYYADIMSGFRYYNIGPGFSNTHYTIVCDDNVITGETYNSKWEEYQANNNNRWLAYGVNAGIEAVKSLASGYATMGLADKILDMKLDNIGDYALTKSGKRAKNKSNYFIGREINKALASHEETMLDTTVSTGSNLLDEVVMKPVGMLMTEKNLKLTPNKVARQGNSSSFGPMDSLNIYRWTDKVIDYEKVAWHYHLFGYLLMQPEKESIYLSDLIEKYRNRYWFNYLSLADCDVHTRNTLEARDIMSNLKGRLASGIRYWNVDNGVNIGTYEYDNIELEEMPQ